MYWNLPDLDDECVPSSFYKNPGQELQPFYPKEVVYGGKMSGKKAGEFSVEEVIAEFERLTLNAAAVQRETLRRILDENAGVEYLQRHGLAGRSDPDTFRACVPLATHDDLEPFIVRVADGDTSPVLTAKPITSISLRFVLLIRRRFQYTVCGCC
jgi:hypothetical protein